MLEKECDIIDTVESVNKYAVFSTIIDDPIFKNVKDCINNPIFCCGKIISFKNNVYNLKLNDIVVYISSQFEKNIQISSNLILKLSNTDNLNLIALIPYGSFAMKILRKINPKLEQSIVIIGLNFFSILIKKLLNMAGANVIILNDLEKDLIKINKISIDTLIILNDLETKNQEILNSIKYKSIFYLNRISFYDKGLKDNNYICGIKYPYSYIRWDFRENLKYFIYLIENEIINLDFLEIIIKKVNSIEEIRNILNSRITNSLILFKLNE